MTIVTHIPGTPDPTLPATLPDFGLDPSEIKHLWHPRTFESGSSGWGSSVSQFALPEHGDNSSTKTVEDGRPIVNLTTGSTFIPGDVLDGVENATILLVARVKATDALSGAGYLMHNGRDGINMPTFGDDDVTFTNGAPATTAQLDKWHLFSMTTPAAGFTRFTVDGVLSTATGGVVVPETIRLGGNNTVNKRAMSIAMVLSCVELPAATITDIVYPLVKEWWRAFDWAS